MTNNDNLLVYKISHPVKMRMLQVVRTYWPAPYLCSVIFTGEELKDFTSLSFNDHVKVFFPALGKNKPILPILNPNGSLDTSNMQGTFTRDFTPRHFDDKKNELEIQFFIHKDRQASSWAIRAQPGDFIGVGGPKKSLMIPSQFDWFLMIGDETAIPAISRRLEELPREARTTIMIETEYPETLVEFRSVAKVETYWIDKNKHTLLQQLIGWTIPQGEGFIWAAGEFSSMNEIYTHLIRSGSIDKSRLKISSYWKKGHPNTHGTFGKDS